MDNIDCSKCIYKGGLECHIHEYPIPYCGYVAVENCYFKQLKLAEKQLEEDRIKIDSLELENVKLKNQVSKHKEIIEDLNNVIERIKNEI